jgi:hypothetical protein
MLSRTSEVSLCVLIACFAALGCGGKSSTHDDGSRSEAGADSGGSSGAGGSMNSGGRGGSVSSGGRGGAGGSGMAAVSGAGGTAQAGGGGMPPVDRCALPAPNLRSCDGSPFFYHDVTTGECMGVTSMQCPDDLSRTFRSLAECLDSCPSARPAPNACDVTSDCIIAQPGCCAACEPLAEEQFVAIHHARRDTLGGDCDVACGPCNQVTELERTGQYFVPACGQVSCLLLDLRRTSAACDSDDDCSLRDGSACCEGCDGTGLVALSSTEYVEATCAPNTGCDGCVPNIPAEFEAGCNDNGHCVVRQKSDVFDGHLIRGDARCPANSRNFGIACGDAPPSECIYAGGLFGLSNIGEPVSCFCGDTSSGEAAWSCLATDANGNSDCPRKYPLGDTACTSGQRCTYGVDIVVAACSCAVDEAGEGTFSCAL